MNPSPPDHCPPRGPTRLHIWLEKVLRPKHDLIIALGLNVLGACTYWGINSTILPFPVWLPVTVLVALEVPLVWSYLTKRIELNQGLGYALVIAQFLFVVLSVVNLIQKLPQHREIVGEELIRSGAMLWIANLLCFTMWYWRFDGGGPHLREGPECGHVSFLFPQFLLNKKELGVLEQDTWRPAVMDYLFLAFNTSTALSPADTAVIGRAAKATTMMQSLLALAIVVVVIGRGVNAM